MSKRILYLSDYELTAFHIAGRTLHELQRFQLSHDGETEFAKYLNRDVKTPIYWIVDTTSEEYQIARLPHVLGKDRTELMNHKRKRLFEHTSYSYSVVQGREMGGRGDDEVLFMALNNSALLQPWLNWIHTYKVPLVGIYSLPLLSENLLTYLPKSPYTLLVTQTPPISAQSEAGLRQSFFVNQKLQFSRLIPLDSLEPEQYANYVIKQIITTHRYLDNSQRLPPTEHIDPLSVLILTDNFKIAALKQAYRELVPGFNIQILLQQRLTQRLPIRLRSKEPLSWHHFVIYQLSQRWLAGNHYAKWVDSRYYSYRHWRLTIYLIALLLFSGLVTASWLILEKTLVIQDKGKNLVTRTESRRVELEQLRQREPQLPINIVFLRNVVEMGFYLKAHHISPRLVWEQLSQVLARHSDLFLERLEWGIGHSLAEIFAADDIPSREQAEQETVNGSPLPWKDFDPNQHFIEGMRVYGKIYPFKGNYQQAVHTFTLFVKDLSKQYANSWKVEVLLSPYDPNRILQGKIGVPSEIGNAPFVINIFIRHEYAKNTSANDDS
jgi:hypothetical protein